MLDAIANSVHDLRVKGHRSIGILSRYSEESRKIHNFLLGERIEHTLLTTESQLKDGITVSLILLAKGLEFDAVIVASVNGEILV